MSAVGRVALPTSPENPKLAASFFQGQHSVYRLLSLKERPLVSETNHEPSYRAKIWARIAARMGASDSYLLERLQLSPSYFLFPRMYRQPQVGNRRQPYCCTWERIAIYKVLDRSCARPELPVDSSLLDVMSIYDYARVRHSRCKRGRASRAPHRSFESHDADHR